MADDAVACSAANIDIFDAPVLVVIVAPGLCAV
jgi:hypothetical protein